MKKSVNKKLKERKDYTAFIALGILIIFIIFLNIKFPHSTGLLLSPQESLNYDQVKSLITPESGIVLVKEEKIQPDGNFIVTMQRTFDSTSISDYNQLIQYTQMLQSKQKTYQIIINFNTPNQQIFSIASAGSSGGRGGTPPLPPPKKSEKICYCTFDPLITLSCKINGENYYMVPDGSGGWKFTNKNDVVLKDDPTTFDDTKSGDYSNKLPKPVCAETDIKCKDSTACTQENCGKLCDDAAFKAAEGQKASAGKACGDKGGSLDLTLHGSADNKCGTGCS